MCCIPGYRFPGLIGPSLAATIHVATYSGRLAACNYHVGEIQRGWLSVAVCTCQEMAAPASLRPSLPFSACAKPDPASAPPLSSGLNRSTVDCHCDWTITSPGYPEQHLRNAPLRDPVMMPTHFLDSHRAHRKSNCFISERVNVQAALGRGMTPIPLRHDVVLHGPRSQQAVGSAAHERPATAHSTSY